MMVDDDVYIVLFRIRQSQAGITAEEIAEVQGRGFVVERRPNDGHRAYEITPAGTTFMNEYIGRS